MPHSAGLFTEFYENESMWSSAMSQSAGQNCVALDKLVKLWTHELRGAICFKKTFIGDL
jgi:hypothetical protein